MLWSDFARIGRFWDPWEEFERMRRSLSRAAAPSSIEFPAVNLWSGADSAVITTELPGIEPADIDLSVTGNVLTLRGTRKPQDPKEGETYHRRERWYGQFSKSVELPFNIEAGKVQANFSKGVLSVSLPRAEAEKPKKITISSE